MGRWRITPVGWIIVAGLLASVVLIVVGSHGILNVAVGVAAVLGLILASSGIRGWLSPAKSLEERQAEFRGGNPD